VGEVRQSGRSVGEQWQKLRVARADRMDLAQQRDAEYQERMKGLSPSERFAAEAQRGGWTPADLVHQERAARIARRVCMGLCLLGFLGFLVFMYFASLFWAVINGLLVMVLLGVCRVQAVRHAWWEFQLQGRVLLPLRGFVSRPDLFRRLFA